MANDKAKKAVLKAAAKQGVTKAGDDIDPKELARLTYELFNEIRQVQQRAAGMVGLGNDFPIAKMQLQEAAKALATAQAAMFNATKILNTRY